MADENDIWGRIHENDSTLTGLQISEANDGDITTLITALRGNNQITRLELGGENITDESAHRIAQFLARSDSIITHLDIRGSSITDNGAIALANILATNERLINLSLAGAEIGNTGAIAFATALTSNNTLSSLDLSHNTVGDQGLSKLLHSMRGHNNTLCELRIEPNDNITDLLKVEHLHERLRINRANKNILMIENESLASNHTHQGSIRANAVQSSGSLTSNEGNIDLVESNITGYVTAKEGEVTVKNSRINKGYIKDSNKLIETDGLLTTSKFGTHFTDATFATIERAGKVLTAQAYEGERLQLTPDGILRGGTVEINGERIGADKGNGVNLARDGRAQGLLKG